MPKAKIDKSPRQLARLASLHRLPSREESVESAKSHGHAERQLSKLGARHQSFLVRSSTTAGGGNNSLGSRGSSFSFKRTYTPPEQVRALLMMILCTSLISFQTGHDDISSVSMSEARTSISTSSAALKRNKPHTQSAANLHQVEWSLSTQSSRGSHHRALPRAGSQHSGGDPSPKGSIWSDSRVMDRHRLEDDLKEEGDEDEEGEVGLHDLTDLQISFDDDGKFSFIS
jgi:hypothetical protein